MVEGWTGAGGNALNTVIQATGVDLDHALRRELNSQLTRDLVRFAKNINIVTAYVTLGTNQQPYCRIAVLTVDGKRLSTESGADSHVMALNQAGSQMAAALQREAARATDPRLNRPKR